MENSTGGGLSSSTQKVIKTPCAVCGDEASGFHYGVDACEGCKGFFRRCLIQGMNNECQNNNKCEITLHTRNTCQACRYAKCRKVGMSKEGVRLGRRPKKLKTPEKGQKISPKARTTPYSKPVTKPGFTIMSLFPPGMLQMLGGGNKFAPGMLQQAPEGFAMQLGGVHPTEPAVHASLDGSNAGYLQLLSDQPMTVPQQSEIKLEPQPYPSPALSGDPLLNYQPLHPEMEFNMSDMPMPAFLGEPIDLNSPGGDEDTTALVDMLEQIPTPLSDMTDEQTLTSLADRVIKQHLCNNLVLMDDTIERSLKAHEENCICTLKKLEKANAYAAPLIEAGVVGDVFGKIFMEEMVGIIKRVVKYCGRLPGFHDLDQHDPDQNMRLQMIKSALFEIIVVRFTRLLDTDTDTMIDFSLDKRISRSSVTGMSNFGPMFDEIFKFAATFKQLHMNDEEMALFCAILLFNSDNVTFAPDVEESQQQLQCSDIAKLQRFFMQTLFYYLRKVNPTEAPMRLLRFIDTVKFIRQINNQHWRTLNRAKESNPGQVSLFPALHKEVFDLQDDTNNGVSPHQ